MTINALPPPEVYTDPARYQAWLRERHPLYYVYQLRRMLDQFEQALLKA